MLVATTFTLSNTKTSLVQKPPRRPFSFSLLTSLPMLAATMASYLLPTARIKSASTGPNSNPALSAPPPVSSFLSTSYTSPFVGGDLSGLKIGPTFLNPNSPGPRGRRSFVTKVIPSSRGEPSETPPDLETYIFSHRIVYLGFSLVPQVTELLLAEFMYLQSRDAEKPIYFYINSTGVSKGDKKLNYEMESFAVYDIMRSVEPPIYTLCVGNAWGEAALLLAAGVKGSRAALPSANIMIREPIIQFQGQAADVEIVRRGANSIKAYMVKVYSECIGKSREQIEEDIRRPKYFTPSEAVEYGIIDKILYNERAKEDGGVLADWKKKHKAD